MELELIDLLADREQRPQRRGRTPASGWTRSRLACRSRRGTPPRDTTGLRPLHAASGTKARASFHRKALVDMPRASARIGIASGLAAAGLMGFLVYRPWHLRWGSTDEEVR